MNHNLTKSIVLLIVTVLFTACGGGGSKEASSETSAEETTSEAMEASYGVDNSASSVEWKGEVAGVYGHNGIINISSGSLTAKGSMITGGEIVIDMTSISPTDSTSYADEDGKRATDLVGHLSTGDFFLVEEFPTASFKVKSHEGNKLLGDLTIRGTTKEATAEIASLEVTEEALKGEGTLVFNRQDFGVNWKHYVKDYILSDDIEIKLNIVASK